MKILEFVTKIMCMSDDVWLRHANPWSVWTRIPSIFVLVLAFWSRIWIGLYFIIPVSIVLLWAWLNPRIFPKPKSMDNWGGKGVFGEKIFTSQKKEKVNIPKHHIVAAYITIIIIIIGSIILIYGLWILDLWITIAGTSIAFLGKMWFVDRMVWLHEDMKETNPNYKKWLYKK